MLTKRIIACLDIKNGRVVKGIHFEHIRDAGNAVELATLYSHQGADELVFLDITATGEKRKTFHPLVRELAQKINIPFTVGGGVSTLEDFSMLLQNGADKISINTAAFKHPDVLKTAAREFGSQCVVLAIDAKKEKDGKCYVYLNGGKVKTNTTALEWAKRGVEHGAGEILLTSMDHDGTKQGFALELVAQFAAELPVPVIASGGAGTMVHFKEVFQKAHADAALAAGIFHFGEMEIPDLKRYLRREGVEVRL